MGRAPSTRMDAPSRSFCSPIEDLAERKRRLNATHTIEALLATGVIPIVNENDTVAVEEIRMGDNDVLSSLVAGDGAGADCWSS